MRDLKKALKGMNIDLQEVDAETVMIKLRDGRKYVFSNPSVILTRVQGQETFQIVGKYEIESPEGYSPSDEDVKLVASQAGVSEEEARRALIEKNGDLAEAINYLLQKGG
ncbi:MAG: nascent polypeptide-associated complex protein [Candidatus Methanodesulfokora sp.]